MVAVCGQTLKNLPNFPTRLFKRLVYPLISSVAEGCWDSLRAIDQLL